MSSDLNKAILVGRLIRDCELKYTQSGTSVASFSIANNKSYTQNGEKKEQVSFFNCVAWGKLGEIMTEHCKKGMRIGIEGRLQQRSWDDKDGNKRSTVEIVVETFQFLDSKKGTSDTIGDSFSGQSVDNQPEMFDDSSIPF